MYYGSWFLTHTATTHRLHQLARQQRGNVPWVTTRGAVAAEGQGRSRAGGEGLRGDVGQHRQPGGAEGDLGQDLGERVACREGSGSRTRKREKAAVLGHDVGEHRQAGARVSPRTGPKGGQEYGTGMG